MAFIFELRYLVCIVLKIVIETKLVDTSRDAQVEFPNSVDVYSSYNASFYNLSRLKYKLQSGKVY